MTAPATATSHCTALHNGGQSHAKQPIPRSTSPLSNAERQARYRARLKMQEQKPQIRYRRPADQRSRLKRWVDAVAELLSLQAYYTAWFDALPDGLRDTPTAIALQAIIDLDLEELAAVVPPRGYGRD